jgi:hypothetical protein
MLTKRTAAADVVTLTATDALGLAKGVSLVFTFPCKQACIDVEWRVKDKTPDPIPEGGWLCFPFAVTDPEFLLGRLGGPIDPAKDIIPGANRHYFCVSTGVAVTDKGGIGMGVCPIDSPCVSLGEPGLWKFSLDYLPKLATVFVNLYNNKWRKILRSGRGMLVCRYLQCRFLGKVENCLQRVPGSSFLARECL